MRAITTLFTAAVVPLAAACGSDPPFFCGDGIPQQEVFVGEQKTVDVCFTDPGGGVLTVEASSADPDVVRTVSRADNVGITGVSPGEASVTVTATNDEGLSAETSFAVRVPNRPPKFVSSIREATIAVGRTLVWNLMDFFEEPDREPMTFAATSSNTTVATVDISGSVARVSGLDGGVSEVILTAKDPHGSEGTGTVEVTVKTPVTVFEDDFGSDESLDDWAVDASRSDVWVESGVLFVRAVTRSRYGTARRDVDRVVDYQIDLTMAAHGDDAGAIWLTGLQDGDIAYRFLIGDLGSRNWLFSRFQTSTNSFSTVAGGNSDLVVPDDFLEYTITLSIDGNVQVFAGDSMLADEDMTGSAPAIEEIWLVGPPDTATYDYAKLSGFADSDQPMRPGRIAKSILDRMIVLSELDLPVKR